jgi:hypothetical protein
MAHSSVRSNGQVKAPLNFYLEIWSHVNSLPSYPQQVHNQCQEILLSYYLFQSAVRGLDAELRTLIRLCRKLCK